MKKPKKVDSLIVGGGLIGLKLLKRLEAENKSVLLIEQSSNIGGSTFSFDKETSKCELHSLLWTTDDSKETETFTLGRKGLSPFLSFGSYNGDALSVAESFIQANSTPLKELDLSSSQNTDETFNFATNTNIKTLTQATELLKSTEGSLLCQLNGKDFIEYTDLHWTASLDQLLKLKAKDELIEIRQKLGKHKRFDGLTIQFSSTSDQSSDRLSEQFKDHKDSKFILFGETDTPWMGALLNDNVLTFTSFFLSSKSQDHDFIRRHLKSLKRQVRKIFPDLYDEDQISVFSKDRLTVHTEVLSQMPFSAKTQSSLKPLLYYGSHKGHYPSPFESKEKMIFDPGSSKPKMSTTENLKEDSQTPSVDTSKELQNTLDPDLAM